MKDSNEEHFADRSMLTVMSRPQSRVVVVLASGAHAGRSFGIHSDTFQIGSSPDCQVRLDPSEIADARKLRFRMGVDGWNVELIGGAQYFVAQKRATDATRLRSGDVIRMSHAGPDLQFYLQVDGDSIKQLVEKYLPSTQVSESTELAHDTHQQSVTASPPSPKASTDQRRTELIGSPSTDAVTTPSMPDPSSAVESERRSRATQAINVGGDGSNRTPSESAYVEAAELWRANRSASDSPSSWQNLLRHKNFVVLATLAVTVAIIAFFAILILIVVVWRAR